MSEISPCRAALRTIAVIGNHLPRQCGIATFTTDLLLALSSEAPDVDCWAMAMNDVPEGYRYPHQVRFELNYKNLADYRLAADFLNMNQVDAVCLQHEFGIFGGRHGSYILELLHNLRMPVVTTLHTVIREPDAGQKAILEELGRISDRLVVMSHKAEEMLKEVYGVSKEKIVLIHHGIPDVAFVDPNYYKDLFGVEGQKVILTFGLLSEDKGIEYMIDALAEIVKTHPETAYIILGATHPHLKRDQGESYRLYLQRRARERGVENHIIFHNRFVGIKELCEFLGAADIYVTPYLNAEQIVSGTLAYALGAGKAAISTPYWYAQEMLADKRGRIVPFRDANALAAQVIHLLANEVERHAMRKRAYTFCRDMVWREVARRYLEVIIQTKAERELRPRAPFRAKILKAILPELPPPKLDHLDLLTDDTGILQHSKFMVPDRSYGYCTDDNARALIAVLMAQNLLAETNILIGQACRYIGFLNHAFNQANGRFRNFMGYDRRWLEKEGSEDSHGRAIWGLGMAVALSKSESLAGAASSIFKQALPVMTAFKFPRAWAFALVGIHAYLRRFGGDTEVRRLRATLAKQLFELYQANATDDWPWIEDRVTYANGKIPHALLMSGRWLYQDEMTEAGLRCLEWLVRIQTDPKGHFVPIGNHGWLERNGERARFDQQPIEAQDMIEACVEAYKITGDKEWLDKARRCFDWFLGRNDLNIPLYDYRTGGCRDGLTADGANLNQGAESTLAWLLSLLCLHSVGGPLDVTTK
ncbi:MAG: glycosyl transferase family 1 [Desulfobacterales bacterium C00003060]|nr:MAG: glycosyl transferase family 1 [Desulfobacterales bacterium S3730MH5]OEU81587.1 MAG: glycosyl transferase family 1 [Desulfobacterales bacterium C00003060]